MGRVRSDLPVYSVACRPVFPSKSLRYLVYCTTYSTSKVSMYFKSMCVPCYD